MSHAVLEIPTLRLEDSTNEEVRQCFESMSSYATPDMRQWATRMAQSHVRHYQVVFRYVHEICSKQPVERALDIGAVPGFITATLKQNGLNVEAVDLAPERTRGIFDLAGVPFHKVDVERERLPFENDSIDLVLFNEIIEHLRINPILPIREIYRVLRPGGAMLLSTPNITLALRLRFLLGHDYQGDLIAEFDKLESVGHMGHFRLYSRSELHQLLKHVGFDTIKSRAYETRLAKPSWRRRLAMRLIPEHAGDHLYVLAIKGS